jgi:molybdate/tungstate transport system permease protein
MSARSLPWAPFVLALAALLLLLAAPLAMLVAMVPAGDVLRAFATPEARAALRTSGIASVSATLLATILGVPAGYALAHAARPVRAAALFLLALPPALPPVAAGILLLAVTGEHGPLGSLLARFGLVIPDTRAGVALAEFFVGGSFVALGSCAAFASLDPAPAEAARTLGIGEWTIFARICLPAAAGTIGAAISFAWLRAIGEYGATSIVAFHPTSLPVEIYVALSASGIDRALALTYGCLALAAGVLAVQWILRARVV